MSGVIGEEGTGGLKLKIKFSQSQGFVSDLVHNSVDSRACDFSDAAATNQTFEHNNIRHDPLNDKHNFISAEPHSPHIRPSCTEVLGDGSYTYIAMPSSVCHRPASLEYTNSQNDEHDGRVISSADQHEELHFLSAAQGDQTMNKQRNTFGWQQVDCDLSGVEQHARALVDAQLPSVGGFDSCLQSEISIGARGYFVPPAPSVTGSLAPSVQRGGVGLPAATHEGGIFSSWRFMDVGSRGQGHRPRLPRLTAPGLVMPSSYQNEMVNSWHLRQLNDRKNNGAISPEDANTVSNSHIGSAHVRAAGSDTVPDTDQGEIVNGWKLPVDINENKDKNENEDAVGGHEKIEEGEMSFDEEPMSPFEINCGLGLSDEINFSTPPHSPGKGDGIVRVTLLPNEIPLCPWIVNESPNHSPCKQYTTSVQGPNPSPDGCAKDSSLIKRFSSEKGIKKTDFHCDDQNSNILAIGFISSRDQFSVNSENSTPSPALESLPSPAYPQPSPRDSRDQPMYSSAKCTGQLKRLSGVLEKETSSNMRHSPEGNSNLVQSGGEAETNSHVDVLRRLLTCKNKAPNTLREAISPARHDSSAHTTVTTSSMNRNNLALLDLCSSVEQMQKNKEKEDEESADQNHVSICTQTKYDLATKKKKRNRELQNQNKSNIATPLVENPSWCRCEEPLFDENEDGEPKKVSESPAALPRRCKRCWKKLGKERMQRKRKHKSDSSVTSDSLAMDNVSSQKPKTKRIIHIEDVWCRCKLPEAHIPEGSVAEMCKTCCRRLSKKWKRVSAAKWCKCDRPMLSKWVPEQEGSVCDSDSLYSCKLCGKCVSKDREACGVKDDQILPPIDETTLPPMGPKKVMGDHSYSHSPFSPENVSKVKFVPVSVTSATPANQRQSLPVSSGQQTLLMPITGLPSTATKVVVVVPPNFMVLQDLSPPALTCQLAGPYVAPVPQSHLQVDGTVEPPSGKVFYVNSGSHNLTVSPSQLKFRSPLNRSEKLPSSSSSLVDSAIFRTEDMNSRMIVIKSSLTKTKLTKKGNIFDKVARPLPSITKSCHVVLEKMNEGLNSIVATAVCPVQCRRHVLNKLCKDGKLDDCDLSLINRVVLEKVDEKFLSPRNRKRAYFTKHKTYEGYEEYKRKLQEEKKAKEVRQWLASRSMSSFPEMMSQPSNDATMLRIQNGNITYMGNTSLPPLSNATQVLNSPSVYGQTPITTSTTSPLLVSSSSQLPTTSSMTPQLLVSSSSQLSVLPSKLNLPSLNSNSPSTNMIITTCLSSKSGQQMPPKKNIGCLEKNKDSNWMRMYQFNVKYYVFQSHNRAFFVPFFKRKGRRGKIQSLDDEDYAYVKEAVADLLAEETSCARMLQYPESLQHKGVRRTMAPTVNTDTTSSKKAFVAPTLGAEDLDLESLTELVNNKDFSRLVQRTSRMSQSTYLQLIGEKLAMYLGLDHSSRWIRSLARKVVSKKAHGKKAKAEQRRKRRKEKLVPTKGISIEMDYALEEGGHMEDDVDFSEQVVCENSCASEYEGVDTTNVFEDFVSAATSGQKTGSFVCEEEFAQEDRKPLLSDLMQMVPISAPLSFDLTTPVVGFPSKVPLSNGFDQVSAEVSGRSEASHFALTSTEKKPLLGELLAASVMTTAASSLDSSFQQHNTFAVEKPMESLQTSERFDQTSFAGVNVKLEPQDDDYASAWAYQNTEQTLARQTHIPFISNATFGKDAVQIDDDPGRASVDLEKPFGSVPLPSSGLLPPAPVMVKMEPPENDTAIGVPMITCLASEETAALLTQSDYVGLSVGDSISASVDGQCNTAVSSSVAEEMPLITLTRLNVEADGINNTPVSCETQEDADNTEPFLKISAVASGEAAALWQNDRLSPQKYDSVRGVSQAPVGGTLPSISLDLSVTNSVTHGNTLEIQKREMELKTDELYEENVIAGSQFEEDQYNDDNDCNDNFEDNADDNVDQLPHSPESMLISFQSSFSVVSDSQGVAIPDTSDVKPFDSRLSEYQDIQMPLVLPAVTSESTDTLPETKPLLTNVDGLEHISVPLTFPNDMIVGLTQAPSVSSDFTDSLPDTKPLLTTVSGVQHISVPLALPIDTPVAVAQSLATAVPALLGLNLSLVKEEPQDHEEIDSSLLAQQTISYTAASEQEEIIHLKIPAAVDTSASMSNMASPPLIHDVMSLSNLNLNQESSKNILDVRSFTPILEGQSNQAKALSPFHALGEVQCNKTKPLNPKLKSPKHKRKRYPYSFSAERKRSKKKAPETSKGLSKRLHQPTDQMGMPAAVDTPAGRISDAMCETQITNSNATRAGSGINIQPISGNDRLETSISLSAKRLGKTTIPDADKQKHIISVFLGSQAVSEGELPIPLAQQRSKKPSDAASSSPTSESFRVCSSHPPSNIWQKTVIHDTMKKDISTEQPHKDTVLNTLTQSVAKTLVSDKQIDFAQENEGSCDLYVSEKIQTAKKDFMNLREHSEECSVKESSATGEEKIPLLSPRENGMDSTQREIIAQVPICESQMTSCEKTSNKIHDVINSKDTPVDEKHEDTTTAHKQVLPAFKLKIKKSKEKNRTGSFSIKKAVKKILSSSILDSAASDVCNVAEDEGNAESTLVSHTLTSSVDTSTPKITLRITRTPRSDSVENSPLQVLPTAVNKEKTYNVISSENKNDLDAATASERKDDYKQVWEGEIERLIESENKVDSKRESEEEMETNSVSQSKDVPTLSEVMDDDAQSSEQSKTMCVPENKDKAGVSDDGQSIYSEYSVVNNSQDELSVNRETFITESQEQNRAKEVETTERRSTRLRRTVNVHNEELPAQTSSKLPKQFERGNAGKCSIEKDPLISPKISQKRKRNRPRLTLQKKKPKHAQKCSLSTKVEEDLNKAEYSINTVTRSNNLSEYEQDKILQEDIRPITSQLDYSNQSKQERHTQVPRLERSIFSHLTAVLQGTGTHSSPAAAKKQDPVFINAESKTRAMLGDSQKSMKDYASNVFEIGDVQESVKVLETLQDEKMSDTPEVEIKADSADSSFKVIVNKDKMDDTSPVESKLNKACSSKKASADKDLSQPVELRRASQSPVFVTTSEIKSEPAVDREGIFSRLIGLRTSITETHNLETKSTAQILTQVEVSEAAVKTPLEKINASGLLSRLRASISCALTSAKASVSKELAPVQESGHSTLFTELNKEPASVDAQESVRSTSAPSDKSNPTLKSAEVVKPRSPSSRTLRSRGKSSQVSKEPAFPKRKPRNPSLSSSSEVLPSQAKVARRCPRKTKYQRSQTPPEPAGLQYSPDSTLLQTQTSKPLQNSPAPSFTESFPASTSEENSPITKSLQTSPTVTEPTLSLAQSVVSVIASLSLESLATPALPSSEVAQAKNSEWESVKTSASESVHKTSALELTASPNSRDSKRVSKLSSRVMRRSQSKSVSPITARPRPKSLKSMPNKSKSSSGALTYKGKIQPASPAVQSEEPTIDCQKFLKENNSELDNGEASTISFICSPESFSDGVLVKEFTKEEVTQVSSSKEIGLFAFLNASTSNSSIQEGSFPCSDQTPSSHSRSSNVVESRHVKDQEASESEQEHARSFFDCLPQGLMNAWTK